MPKLIVTTDKLPYGKVTYHKGDDFDASDKDAELLVKIGKARLAEPAPNASDLPREVMSRASKREPIAEEPAKVEEPVAPSFPPEAYTYDSDVTPEAVEVMRMKAEKAMKAEAVEEDEAPKSPVMTYHRRDLVAEAPKAKPVAPPVSKPPLQQPKKRGRPSGKRS